MTKLGASLFRRPQLNFQTRSPQLLHIPLNTFPNADNSIELSQHRACLATASYEGHLQTNSHRFLFPSKPQEVSCRVGCLGYQKIQLDRNMPTVRGERSLPTRVTRLPSLSPRLTVPYSLSVLGTRTLQAARKICRFNSIGVSTRKSCPQLWSLNAEQ